MHKYAIQEIIIFKHEIFIGGLELQKFFSVDYKSSCAKMAS